MKLTTLMLADHASVREGTLGVLGGFVNQLWRPSFPSTFSTFLVAVVESAAGETDKAQAQGKFRFTCLREGDDEPFLEGEGNIEFAATEGKVAYSPMVFDLTNFEIPQPGTFVIAFSIDDQEPETLTFYAQLA